MCFPWETGVPNVGQVRRCAVDFGAASCKAKPHARSEVFASGGIVHLPTCGRQRYRLCLFSALNKSLSQLRRQAGFTLVEVMMAAVIMMVGFIGLVEAVALATSSMDHARRQTLATQIINHEIEDLFLASWSTIAALPTGSTAITIDSQFHAAM